MDQTLSVIMRWSGRVLILLAAFILVASLFLPDAVQPLSPLICPDGTNLDNGRYALPGGPDNAKLELVCTSPRYTQSAAHEVLLVVIGLAAVGLIALWLSQRLARQKVQQVAVPKMH